MSQAYTYAKVLKRVAMSENITILTFANHTCLVKTFNGPELTEKSFAIGKDFKVTEEPVSDLQSLSRILERLQNDPTQTIIRGSLIAGKTNHVSRNKETFTSTTRQWCMIDIDSLALDGDINNQRAMLSYAIHQLPAEFQSVDFRYHFSSSMGIKPGIRVHLWFWLERPCSDDEMKAWLSGCPVDCPSSYKLGHKVGLSYGGSDSSVGLFMQPAFDVASVDTRLSVS